LTGAHEDTVFARISPLADTIFARISILSALAQAAALVALMLPATYTL